MNCVSSYRENEMLGIFGGDLSSGFELIGIDERMKIGKGGR